MTDEQINNMIKKHNDLMDFMTEDEREKYYESYRLQKKDCAVCEAKDICVYATEVVPKTQKAYFCKDALERYQKMRSEASLEYNLLRKNLHDILHNETGLEENGQHVRRK